MLNLDQYFCTNPECKDYGKRGLGNLVLAQRELEYPRYF
jgi:hypothetical protein